MIIKSADDKSASIAQLNTYIADARVPPMVVRRITTERNNLSKGAGNEGQAAFQLNFDFGKSNNHMLLHDLRFETQNGATQIDHLLINRFLDFYVLETKTYGNGVSINERGEFNTWINRQPVGIASPIEQNNHHITALKLLLKELVMPERMGMRIRPTMKPYVLVAKASNIKRPAKENFNTDTVIKIDTFKTILDNEDNNTGFFSAVGSLVKVVSSQTIQDLALQLLARHTPIAPNYIGKFGLAPYLVSPVTHAPTIEAENTDLTTSDFSANSAEAPACPKCGSAMVRREAKRGANVGSVFWGCSNYPKCRSIIGIV
jgi:hypothetical protein